MILAADADVALEPPVKQRCCGNWSSEWRLPNWQALVLQVYVETGHREGNRPATSVADLPAECDLG